MERDLQERQERLREGLDGLLDQVESRLMSTWRLWVVACGVLIIILFLPLLHQPYLEDEVTLAKAVQGIVQSGRAQYYAGEFAPSEFERWHTPSYLYFQALVHYLSGGWLKSFRLFGLLLVFPFVAVLFVLARSSYENRPWPYTLSCLALGIFLLVPVAVTNFAAFDIDSAFLAVGMSAFLWLATRWEKTISSPGRLARKLWFPFVAVLWFKMTTTLLLPVVMPLYVAYRRGIREAVRFGAWFAVPGLGLFLVTWMAFTYFYWGSSPWEMFYHVFYRGLIQFSAPDQVVQTDSFFQRVVFLSQKLWNQRYAIPFLSTFLVIIAGIDLVWRIREIWRGAEGCALDLIRLTLWMGILIQSFIRLGVYGYPKYLGPYVPLLVVVSAPRVLDAFRELIRKMSKSRFGVLILLIWLVGMLLLFALSGADPMLPGRHGLLTRLLIPLGTGWGVMRLLWGKPRGSADYLVASCGILHLAVFLVALPVWWRADYARPYCYGQRGFDQTIARLQKGRKTDQKIIAPREIAFYDGRNYVRPEDLISKWNDPEGQAFLRSDGVVAVVGNRCSSVFVSADPQIKGRLKKHFPVEEHYGDYVVRFRK